SYLLYKATGETEQFNETFHQAVKNILTVWEVEQRHENSPYTFTRDTSRMEDTLPEDGKGTKVGYTGMTWSGFRPSDDACQFGYLVPSNMFAVVVLGYLEDIYETITKDAALVERIQTLRDTIQSGIETYGKTKSKDGKTIFAYEVDGLGGSSVMDDSNVPSLLSAPYLGYLSPNDETYLATRQVLLSEENPYFYKGEFAKGIGSSHTPPNYIWPIALAMEGMTTEDKT
ncbi:glycoside hydrolase family 125 protein, partial [Listeria welshimeri]|nr:glycoside hydrolase family 125 protein [Listeria welshimeri]